MKSKKLAASAASVVAFLILALPVQASVVEGQLLGIFAGNDSVASLFADLGLVATELAKVDVPDTSNAGLEITNLIYNDEGEPLSGEWSYSGPEIANIIVLKADGHYAVYAYTDAITNNMPNIGLFDVSDITDVAGQGYALSHITAYHTEVVPIPAAVWLFASGLIGLGVVRRKSA